VQSCPLLSRRTPGSEGEAESWKKKNLFLRKGRGVRDRWRPEEKKGALPMTPEGCASSGKRDAEGGKKKRRRPIREKDACQKKEKCSG